MSRFGEFLNALCKSVIFHSTFLNFWDCFQSNGNVIVIVTELPKKNVIVIVTITFFREVTETVMDYFLKSNVCIPAYLLMGVKVSSKEVFLGLCEGIPRQLLVHHECLLFTVLRNRVSELGIVPEPTSTVVRRLK